MAKKKYAVKLSIMVNSFFDPQSGCNLFRSTPIYAFDHVPTMNIKTGVKHGTLIDLIGNVLEDKVAVAPEPVQVLPPLQPPTENPFKEDVTDNVVVEDKVVIEEIPVVEEKVVEKEVVVDKVVEENVVVDEKTASKTTAKGGKAKE